MKIFVPLTLATLLAVGAAGVAAAPAQAQQKPAKGKKAAAPTERKFNVSKEAAQPLEALRVTVVAKDQANFAAHLAAAQAVAKSPDEKYLIAKYRLQHAIHLKDAAAQVAAIDAVLESGGADAAETTQMQKYLGSAAIDAKDFARAETVLGPVVAANPNDLGPVIDLARAKIELKKDAEGMQLLRRAIQLETAAGRTAPEPWYRNVLGLAYRTKDRAVMTETNDALMRLYPSKENFKNSLILFRDNNQLAPDAELDLLRLMYASGGMTQAGEYVELANMLDENGLPGEAKSVLDAGIRAGVLKGTTGQQLLRLTSARIPEDRASLPSVEAKARAAAAGTLARNTAAAYSAYGDYAKAAELYRLALQKGGVDANVVNTRLGIALALAGRKAEAEAAFRAVTGASAGVAGLWLSWLAQRG